MEVFTSNDSSHGCRGLVRYAPQPPALCVPGRVVLALLALRRWWGVPYHDAAQRAGATAPAPTSLCSVPARGRGCELFSAGRFITRDGSGTSIVVFGASSRALCFNPLQNMDDTSRTIGLTDLLNEVDLDLGELRKKHSTDYGVKNITMWWELERDRLLTRHGANLAIRMIRRTQTAKWLMIYFFAGWIISAAVSAGFRLLIP